MGQRVIRNWVIRQMWGSMEPGREVLRAVLALKEGHSCGKGTSELGLEE